MIMPAISSPGRQLACQKHGVCMVADHTAYTNDEIGSTTGCGVTVARLRHLSLLMRLGTSSLQSCMSSHEVSNADASKSVHTGMTSAESLTMSIAREDAIRAIFLGVQQLTWQGY